MQSDSLSAILALGYQPTQLPQDRLSWHTVLTRLTQYHTVPRSTPPLVLALLDVTTRTRRLVGPQAPVPPLLHRLPFRNHRLPNQVASDLCLQRSQVLDKHHRHPIQGVPVLPDSSNSFPCHRVSRSVLFICAQVYILKWPLFRVNERNRSPSANCIIYPQ